MTSYVPYCLSSPLFGSRYLFYSTGDIYDTTTRKFKKLTTKNDDGYVVVNLVGVDGSKKNYYVHRVIYMAFHSLVSIDNNYQINHIDSHRNNNDISNLELITQRENIRKSKQSQYHPYHNLDVIKYQKNKERKERKKQIKITVDV